MFFIIALFFKSVHCQITQLQQPADRLSEVEMNVDFSRKEKDEKSSSDIGEVEMNIRPVESVHINEVVNLKVVRAEQHLRKQANSLIAALTALIERAHQLLADAGTTPQSFEQLLGEMDSPATHSEQLVHEHATALQKMELLDPLNSAISKAKELQHQLTEKAQHWAEFVRQRELLNEQLDMLRQNLEDVKSRPKISELVEVQSALDAFEVS